MSNFDFVKDFVENDMQYEDYNTAQLENFRKEVIKSGIDVPEETINEREFYKIKRTLEDMYLNTMSDLEDILEDMEEEEEETMKTNTTNVKQEGDTMNNNEVAATEEMTAGEKARQFAENAKEKLTDGFKFVTENIEVAADEVKKMADMKDSELEEYLKKSGKSVLDKIVDAVKKYSGKMKDNADIFPSFKERAEKSDDIIKLIKEVLDEEELNGWGKFKAIVKELIKWLLKLLLKVGAIVLKIAIVVAVGAIKIGATTLVTAGKAIGILNREVVKPAVKEGKKAWANHKINKTARAKAEAIKETEEDLEDDFDDIEEALFEE